MLVVTNTIKVKEGHGAAMAQRFAGSGGVQDMPQVETALPSSKGRYPFQREI
jgi:hypothetical protein